MNKYTHYTHDKDLVNKFVVKKDGYAYKQYIKQVQYHRDEKWINILMRDRYTKEEVEDFLRQLRDITHDWDMNIEIKHTK